jgi:hypothetical protein
MQRKRIMKAIITFEFPRGLIIIISLPYIKRETRIEVCLHLGMI